MFLTNSSFVMCELLANEKEPGYLGDFAAGNIRLAPDHSRSPGLFKNGRTYPYRRHSKRFFAAVARGTVKLPRVFLARVLPELPRLKSRLESGTKVLDIGCGGGFAVVEIAKNFPHTTCLGSTSSPTRSDWPDG